MISDITINLHCGCSQDVVTRQMADHEGLEMMIPRIQWNLRIIRYPKAYPSYSQLMNHAIATSNSEYMIFINDRTSSSFEETMKILKLLESGFSCVYLYNVGYMGFTKELVRKIGWWDERYLLGGWEDRDWTFRIAEADLALYESQESHYDYSWKSPLQDINHQCRLSMPHWIDKWDMTESNKICRTLSEEQYEHWNLFLGTPRPDISKSWKRWNDSVLNIGFDKPNSGPSSSSMIGNRLFG